MRLSKVESARPKLFGSVQTQKQGKFVQENAQIMETEKGRFMAKRDIQSFHNAKAAFTTAAIHIKMLVICVY